MAPKMGGMPSAEVMTDWLECDANLQVVATWAGVQDEVLTEFCSAVGTTPDESLINISYLSTDELTELIDNLTVNGEPATLITKARLRRMTAAINVAVHDPEPEKRAGAPEDMTANPPVEAEKVDLSQVILQGSKIQIDFLSQEALDAAHERYVQARGRPPAKDICPSDEQITAFHYIFNVRNNIYCDFAVFVPFGGRLIKSLRMHGQRLGPDGKLMTLEIYGPASIDEWER